MDIAFLIELTINGALTGLMYGLVALGIVLIYKSSGVPNLAQGAMVMIAAYLVWMVAGWLGAPVVVALLVAVLGMFLFGMLTERVLLRRMVGQPIIMVVMLTLGLESLLRGLGPGLLGAAPKSLDLGIDMMPIIVGDVFINREYLIGGAIGALMIGLALFFFRTRLGTKLLAVSDDHVSSWSVGISVERAVAVSWGLAGVAAVAAGVMWGSVQGVDWSLTTLLFPAVAVVILGGLDSIHGVLVAGLVVGILGSVVPGYVDPLVGGGTRDVVTSLIILLTILFRPHGIFGREEIERV
ncbi:MULTISPECIES: branched-chain amino acid ABC transporter permease [Marichromatium]|uniref:Branched-chain amino acid ABC transporter permease n=3 Tax=Marichromatium TaxID=85076 RepID=W0DZV9_MARPU|nr:MULTISPECIES: branched-chain amino acid ABC transporter permease [Marichromatium]AHF04150.1 branched-chain amino acid ABC transporter permease [Marichromatium purpuratum 984]MBK1709518.1 branched-chain amino acid ABC transporter permease [Marichromatium gracile]NKN34201.1 branched-chain amino acid ABC transporter permease [Marichromatium bheemlicum]RNE89807.1 branched-chain amino acid ABC transporter permease [Marichromatium sp. AB32]RNE90112.1 branched-chain amino acid ABC transporter perm